MTQKGEAGPSRGSSFSCHVRCGLGDMGLPCPLGLMRGLFWFSSVPWCCCAVRGICLYCGVRASLGAGEPARGGSIRPGGLLAAQMLSRPQSLFLPLPLPGARSIQGNIFLFLSKQLLFGAGAGQGSRAHLIVKGSWGPTSSLWWPRPV